MYLLSNHNVDIEIFGSRYEFPCAGSDGFSVSLHMDTYNRKVNMSVNRTTNMKATLSTSVLIHTSDAAFGVHNVPLIYAFGL